MLILPYSTALTLARRPLASWAIGALLPLIFLLQLQTDITQSLVYYPSSWNPLTMLTASLLHADWLHLIGNLVFFLAFAPALELLIGNLWRYLGFMLIIALAVGFAYSLTSAMGATSGLPTLGFSGVVMGVMGLSAYLMPQARIRVLWWYVFAWKIFYTPAWLVVAAYIALDAWAMFSADDSGGVNLVAHVMGGVTGYLYGWLRMRERREETREELDQEIEAMKMQRRYGRERADSQRASRRLQQQAEEREKNREDERFMQRMYQLVTTHRDSEAIVELLERYNDTTPTHELAPVFEHIRTWNPSRTLLCFGRLIIARLDFEKRHGRVLMQIEQCQAISALFILPDVSRTLFYAQMAIDTGKTDVAKNLLSNSEERYAGLINSDQCNHLLRKCGGKTDALQ